MFDFIFSILAMPIRFVAWLVVVLRIANPLPVLRAAFALSRDTQDAIGILTMTAQQQGINAARTAAQDMFDKTLDCQILGTLCWLEIQQSGDIAAAQRWYDTAKEQGTKNQEMLLPVKLYLAAQKSEQDKQKTLDEILERNDLPMEFSRGALLDKAGWLLKNHRWPEAEAIADRIMAIEDQPNATWVKWVAATVNGSETTAGAFKTKLLQQAGPGYGSLLIALGWLYMGDRKKAMLAMHAAEKHVKDVERFDKDLAELANTAEYYTMSKANQG